jgi:hypothetical protein
MRSFEIKDTLLLNKSLIQIFHYKHEPQNVVFESFLE